MHGGVLPCWGRLKQLDMLKAAHIHSKKGSMQFPSKQYNYLAALSTLSGDSPEYQGVTEVTSQKKLEQLISSPSWTTSPFQPRSYNRLTASFSCFLVHLLLSQFIICWTKWAASVEILNVMKNNVHLLWHGLDFPLLQRGPQNQRKASNIGVGGGGRFMAAILIGLSCLSEPGEFCIRFHVTAGFPQAPTPTNPPVTPPLL